MGVLGLAGGADDVVLEFADDLAHFFAGQGVEKGPTAVLLIRPVEAHPAAHAQLGELGLDRVDLGGQPVAAVLAEQGRHVVARVVDQVHPGLGGLVAFHRAMQERRAVPGDDDPAGCHMRVADKIGERRV